MLKLVERRDLQALLLKAGHESFLLETLSSHEVQAKAPRGMGPQHTQFLCDNMAKVQFDKKSSHIYLQALQVDLDMHFFREAGFAPRPLQSTDCRGCAELLGRFWHHLGPALQGHLENQNIVRKDIARTIVPATSACRGCVRWPRRQTSP